MGRLHDFRAIAARHGFDRWVDCLRHVHETSRSNKEEAQRLGLSPYCVWYWQRRFGIPRRPRSVWSVEAGKSVKLTIMEKWAAIARARGHRDERAMWINRYNHQGGTSRTLAREFDTTRAGILYRLHLWGVKVRPRGGDNRSKILRKP